MSVTCDIIVGWDARPEQLAVLGNALWRWCNRTAGNTGIYQYLDNQALADLIAGKLPVSNQPTVYSDRRGSISESGTRHPRIARQPSMACVGSYRLEGSKMSWSMAPAGTPSRRKFLHELKGEAKQVGREFDVLFEESMKQPPEQRTCG